MKYDPVNGVWYDHTPEEWEALYGSGFWTVTGSLARALGSGPASAQPQEPAQPAPASEDPPDPTSDPANDGEAP